MNKNSNSRAAPPSKGGSMLAAVLVGMVLGLALAGGVAWYILQRPSPYVNNAPHESVRLAPDPVKPAPAPVAKAAPDAAGASAVGDSKPRFEFYKVLTDKSDAAAVAPAPAVAKPTAKAAAKDNFFLQAGAFASADDAERLKAKLAMLGMEASVQAATLPDKTVWHRVRLGPYGSAQEVNKASELLKQNGVNATPMRAQ